VCEHVVPLCMGCEFVFLCFWLLESFFSIGFYVFWVMRIGVVWLFVGGSRFGCWFECGLGVWVVVRLGV
jgi:hypothetical protein